jgi:hypothetical protein
MYFKHVYTSQTVFVSEVIFLSLTFPRSGLQGRDLSSNFINIITSNIPHADETAILSFNIYAIEVSLDIHHHFN